MLLKSVYLRQAVNMFEVLFFAVNLFTVICSNTHPCSFNLKNVRKMQPSRHATMGRVRSQMEETAKGKDSANQPLQRPQTGILHLYN